VIAPILPQKLQVFATFIDILHFTPCHLKGFLYNKRHQQRKGTTK
jgi:hypothetical protein